MSTRLNSIDRDLSDRLSTASGERQRAAASAAALLAVERTGLTGDGVAEAVATVTARGSDQGLAARLSGLVESLDDRAFELQEKADEGQATYAEYEMAFSAARAAAALQYALADDPTEAAIEGVYEAHAAIGDLDGINRVVQEAWQEA